MKSKQKQSPNSAPDRAGKIMEISKKLGWLAVPSLGEWSIFMTPSSRGDFWYFNEREIQYAMLLPLEEIPRALVQESMRDHSYIAREYFRDVFAPILRLRLEQEA